MRSRGLRLLLAGTILGVAACQPERQELEIDTGAIPAAPDVRPGTETAPGGVALPGVAADTVAGQPTPGQVGESPVPTDTI